ncbi:MAG: CARDB domain-containing protein, partial [Halobacteriaceae archaeon]
TMYLDGQEHVFYDETAGPGNSPWLLFEINHFSTRQISFQSTGTQTGNASFNVSGLSAPTNVTQGNAITVNATVTNTGNASGQTTVEYRFNGTQRDSTSVSLNAGNATDVGFTFNTSGITADTYTHGVFTGDDNQTAEITVEASGGNTSDGGNGSDDGSSVSPGPKQGPPPADLASFTSTAALTAQQTTPDSLSGNYTLQITVTGNATNVTFFLQRQAVESSQNISNVTMYLDGQNHTFYDTTAGPGNSPWLLFEINHFSTRTVSFTSESTSPPVVGENAPTDVDGDGTFEDVDGNGKLGLNDITALWANQKSSAVQNNPNQFDFDDSGGISINDITALWNQYRSN